MNKELKNKKILLVGAGGLIGKELTSALYENKITIVAFDKNIDQIKDFKQKRNIDSEKFFIHQGNFNSEEDLKNLFKLHPDIDGVVNLAYPRNNNYGKDFFDVEIESFLENVCMHLGGLFLLTKILAKKFKDDSRPISIVNFSSIYGVIAPKFDIYNDLEMTTPVEYAVVKSSMLNFSQYMVKYIGSSDFRINVISPGGILDNQHPKFIKKYTNYTLGKGMLDSSDVVGTTIFLLSESSKYINGQNIIIDDGFTL
tara:strand:- start:18027 stop:18791 length:765 start_codon:yes stop_codon:yes gene_type:complete